jgi:hypothetical protein
MLADYRAVIFVFLVLPKYKKQLLQAAMMLENGTFMVPPN